MVTWGAGEADSTPEVRVFQEGGLPRSETPTGNSLGARITSKGTTSIFQCIKIGGNEHDLALDVIPAPRSSWNNPDFSIPFLASQCFIENKTRLLKWLFDVCFSIHAN